MCVCAQTQPTTRPGLTARGKPPSHPDIENTKYSLLSRYRITRCKTPTSLISRPARPWSHWQNTAQSKQPDHSNISHHGEKLELSSCTVLHCTILCCALPADQPYQPPYQRTGARHATQHNQSTVRALPSQIHLPGPILPSVEGSMRFGMGGDDMVWMDGVVRMCEEERRRKGERERWEARNRELEAAVEAAGKQER